MEKENNNGKVPLLSKIAYGFGDVGCNFSWMFVGNFLMIFYTDVFGIGMGAVAGLMLFSRFWGLDGVWYAAPFSDFVAAVTAWLFLWYHVKSMKGKQEE